MKSGKTILSTIFLVLNLSLFAGGNTGGYQDADFFYLVYPPEMAAGFREGFLVPAGLTAFAWNRFTVQNGKIVTEADEIGFTAVDRIDSKEAGGWMVDTYTFSGSSGRWQEKTELLSVSVSYDPYDRETGRAADPATKTFPVQPSKKALFQAVLLSGRSSGSARIVEIIQVGRLKFKARVEIR